MADSPWLTLCCIDDLPDQAARGFDPLSTGRDALFVVRQGDTLKAYRNVCPHQGASLPWFSNAYLNPAGTRIVCSAHGAQFDIDTGQCLLGPALGKSLDSVDIMVTAEGQVRVRLEKVL